MKKLLIFMLVLGLASVASATIVLSGPSTAEPGETITIEVVTTADEHVNSAILALITDNGLGGVATPGLWSTSFDLTVDPGYWGADYDYGTGEILVATGEAELGHYATGLLYDFTYAIPTSTPLSTMINFTVEDHDEWGYVSEAILVDGVTKLSIGGVDVHVIPEPATIALLGLGSLFLMRRRK